MPRMIDIAGDLPPLSLGDAIAALDASGFDPRDEEAFVAVAPILKGLCANRSFLGDLAVAELKTRCAGQGARNGYSAQVIMVHRSDRRYFIRANFWPAATDSVVKASGTAPFFYGVPHDHNFSFLTVGYLGPGYWSDYYEYDYGQVEGWPGEPVELRPLGRRRLAPGEVMLYRAHRDVHAQLPADSLSVSLNIMEDTAGIVWRDQYRFDPEHGTIAGLLTTSPTEPLLHMAALAGGEPGREVVSHCCRSHPSDRVRARALVALAGAAPSPAARLAVLEDGARAASAIVRRAAAAQLGMAEPA